MKLSTPTLMAILVSSAFVSASPAIPKPSGAEFTGLVKKSDVSDALSIIEELGRLNQKRELVDDENEAFELSKRADNLLTELISALANSGIIGQVWKALTSDPELKGVVSSLVKNALQTAVTQGPALIKALWNSNLLQNLFQTIWKDGSLRSTLFSAAKAIFGSGLNLLKAFLAEKSGGSGATPAATPAAAATAAAAKREVDLTEYYDKRDLVDVAQTVYSAIKSTGIVQSLVKKVLADPTASVEFLSTVFSKGLVVGKDVYNWAKSSGVLQSGLKWLASNGANYAKDIAGFLGSKIANGEASVSDIDGASAPSGTTVATTAAIVATANAAATAAAAAAAGAGAGNVATTLIQKRLY